MSVTELNKNQLEELKSAYFYKVKNNYEYIHDISNEVVYVHFDGICFTEDDFCCTAHQ